MEVLRSQLNGENKIWVISCNSLPVIRHPAGIMNMAKGRRCSPCTERTREHQSHYPNIQAPWVHQEDAPKGRCESLLVNVLRLKTLHGMDHTNKSRSTTAGRNPGPPWNDPAPTAGYWLEKNQWNRLVCKVCRNVCAEYGTETLRSWEARSCGTSRNKLTKW